MGRPRKTEATKNSFGAWLKAAREKSGYSQSELARKTNIFQANISRYETEVDTPLVTTAAILANALGVDLNDYQKIAPEKA